VLVWTRPPRASYLHHTFAFATAGKRACICVFVHCAHNLVGTLHLLLCINYPRHDDLTTLHSYLAHLQRYTQHLSLVRHIVCAHLTASCTPSLSAPSPTLIDRATCGADLRAKATAVRPPQKTAKKVAAAGLASPRVRSATVIPTLALSSHQHPPESHHDATRRLHPLHPSRRPLTICQGPHERAMTCTTTPGTTAMHPGATTGAPVTQSRRSQQHAATRTRRKPATRTGTRTERSRSESPRALSGQAVCRSRRRAAIGATSWRAPSNRREASAARLEAKASRSFQARQVRP
jgi:hypothetical protein